MSASPLPQTPLPLSLRLSPAETAQLSADAQSPQLRQQAWTLNAFFEASEYLLIQMMYDSYFANTQTRVWSGPLPPNPQPNVTGSLEFALVPYWLNHPSDQVLKDIVWLWTTVFKYPLPACLFTVNDSPTVSNYQNLITAITPPNSLVADDGTLYGESQFEQLDLGWMAAVGEYIYHYFQKKPDLHPFVTGNVVVPLAGSSPTSVTIAVVGDWGTGPYAPDQPSVAVMNAIATKANPRPDYIVHLGDVYYAGTDNSSIFLGDEEQNHLVSRWPAAWQGKSFTMNSNHEMYDGAFGYFDVALQSGAPFAKQAGCSYFALQCGPWTILCLDSAYWSTSPMIMNGSITGPNLNDGPGPWINLPGADAQTTFIQSLKLSPNRVIVMTHHNPMTADGSALVSDNLGNALWQQVTGALGGAPAAWYWGHVHNGIVYTTQNATKSSTYCRCVGHGAIPFGSGWGLQQAFPNPVAWFANTPNPVPGTFPRVLNGFALLTINTSGAAAGTVVETFYDQNGNVAKAPFSYLLG